MRMVGDEELGRSREQGVDLERQSYSLVKKGGRTTRFTIEMREKVKFQLG